MFHQLIQHKRDEWFASPDCTVRDVIAYIVRRGMMRDAQIEAIKTYLYLKIACGNRHLRLKVRNICGDETVVVRRESL